MVFPIVLVVIILIMFLGFYISDIVCVRAILQKSAVLYSMNEITEQDIYKEIDNSIFVTQTENIVLNKKDKEICMEAIISVRFPIINVWKREKISVNSYVKNSKDYVVRAKVMFDIAEDISH